MEGFDLASLIHAALGVLGTVSSPDEGQVRNVINRLNASYQLDAEEIEIALRTVLARVVHRIQLGVKIVDPNTHKPWLDAAKPKIEPYFHDRYKLLLAKEGWGPNSIVGLDKTTDDIVDLLGNPFDLDTWKRRGLVIGDVQSGKTATYTSLICKAADAGYKLIVLLTGTLENLRVQTQRRLDAGFVGVESGKVLSRNRQHVRIGVGQLDTRREAVVFTSTASDFRSGTVDALNLSLRSLREPALVVCKKNTKILANLTAWLRDRNEGAGGTTDLPLLVIDDEADNASVNVRGAEDPTQVNQAIRTLLGLFRRTTYVGVTATPFANVFIDPDSEKEMLGNDLFPSDFIYALSPPTNYVGADKIFVSDAGEEQFLREINDAEPVLPSKHRSDAFVSQLPDSLVRAIQLFCVANAIRDLRAEGAEFGKERRTHRSMLVNFSPYTKIQNELVLLVAARLESIKTAIRNFSKLSVEDALLDPEISGLHEAWGSEFAAAWPDWAQIQEQLQDSVLPITSKVVNSSSGPNALNYDDHKEAGLRVIAVGGYSLSRGLTLEGLCISYFRRNSKMYDTLMQMGRWFGYRPGYEDLCRIWLPNEAADWYAHIAEATSELRHEVRRMNYAGERPADFGLKVRTHPGGLLITARNKMKSGQEFALEAALDGCLFETVELPAKASSRDSNEFKVREFIDKLVAAGVSRLEHRGSGYLYRGSVRTIVCDLIREFKTPDLGFSIADLAHNIESESREVWAEWDVLIPGGEGEPVTLPCGEVKPQIRTVTVQNNRKFVVSGTKRRVGSRGAEGAGLTEDQRAKAKALAIEAAVVEEKITSPAEGSKISVADKYYRAVRTLPLLIIHVLKLRRNGDVRQGEIETRPDVAAGDDDISLELEKTHFALGVSFPPSEQERRPKVYRLNKVLLDQLMAEVEDEDSDVEELLA